jgi:hypothetical protein
MIAMLILVLSVFALAQFFLAYCRSLLRMYGKMEVSERGRRLAGLDGAALADEAFPRILRLLESQPQGGDDRTEVLSIRTYYVLLRLLWVALRSWPSVSYWLTAEREDCAHFAAVALDRRVVASTRNIT